MIRLSWVVVACLGMLPGAGGAEIASVPLLAPRVTDVAGAMEQGKAITARAFGVLSTNLMQAVAKGGVTNALEFCSVHALSLTALQVDTNAVVLRRVSHRARNPKNAANTEEREVLERFRAGVAERGAAAPVVRTNQADRITYFAPIVLNNPLCLNCHGAPETEIRPEHAALLRRLYPQDQATGFRLGELRGLWRVDFLQRPTESGVPTGTKAD